MAEEQKQRPFHETVIEAFDWCSGPLDHTFPLLAHLIKNTEITDNHDKIIARIDAFFDFPGGHEIWAPVIEKLKKSLLEQKQKKL
ncbi:MAG: hypothetical protein V1867_00825 [Candidatus Falkowbacteria bacterium]